MFEDSAPKNHLSGVTLQIIHSIQSFTLTEPLQTYNRKQNKTEYNVTRTFYVVDRFKQNAHVAIFAYSHSNCESSVNFDSRQIDLETCFCTTEVFFSLFTELCVQVTEFTSTLFYSHFWCMKQSIILKHVTNSP